MTDGATAFVLAAGHGRRLRPVTDHLPKPLAPVCGVPSLRYALAAAVAAGHRRIVVNAWHLAAQLRPVARWQVGAEIEVVEEPGDEPLGTGGGLRHARDRLADRVTVLNGDVICHPDLRALADAVPPGGAALLLRRHPSDAQRYGVVAADAEGAVVRLRDRREPAQGPVADDTHFTGLHALDTAVLDDLPDGPACIVGDRYLDLLGDRRLRAVVTEAPWLDIGNPAALLTANLAVLCTTLPTALDPFAFAAFARGPRGERGRPPSGVRCEGPVWIGHDAVLPPGATLSETVVGHRATVQGPATLRRCVVLDDAVVPEGAWQDQVFVGDRREPSVSMKVRHRSP